MIRKAFLQENGHGKMEPEIRSLYEGFQARNIPVELFLEKRLLRRQLPVASDTLVAGSIPVVLAALRQLEVTLPVPNDFPPCLEPYLHRRIWRSTVGQVMNHLYEGDGHPVFVKPEGRLKRFSGRVLSFPDDIRYLENTSRSAPVFCSRTVDWVSEYRVFVLGGDMVGTRHYAGDPSVPLDAAVVAEAVARWEQSGEAIAAYGIDFGVLGNGTTALVELNDGFSLGSYGLDSALYTNVVLARWCELIGCATSATA